MRRRGMDLAMKALIPDLYLLDREKATGARPASAGISNRCDVVDGDAECVGEPAKGWYRAVRAAGHMQDLDHVAVAIEDAPVADRCRQSRHGA